MLVLFYPCVDLPTEEERRFSGAALGSHGEDVSPAYHVASGLPPMLVLQGTGDPLYASVNAYCVAVRKSGSGCEFVEYERAPHGFLSARVDQGRWYRQAMLEADRFLAKLGYLPGPSPAVAP